jgi:hypothetical protein
VPRQCLQFICLMPWKPEIVARTGHSQSFCRSSPVRMKSSITVV